MNSRFLTVTLTVVVLILGACAPATPAVPAAPSNPNLILATTTSTQDSGLLDVLVPLFQVQTGYTVQTVAVGSGAALQMAEKGNADVLLVHAPAAEKELMEVGWGKDRFLVMHNDFVVVGPAEDPAGIKAAATTIDAFKAFAAGLPEVTASMSKAETVGPAAPRRIIFWGSCRAKNSTK